MSFTLLHSDKNGKWHLGQSAEEKGKKWVKMYVINSNGKQVFPIIYGVKCWCIDEEDMQKIFSMKPSPYPKMSRMAVKITKEAYLNYKKLKNSKIEFLHKS